jgi:hypothetical protein
MAELYHVGPQQVWSMCLEDFEVMAWAADERVKASRQQQVHSHADGLRIR